MSKAVENWVNNKTGACLSIQNENLGNLLYDGTVFFRLLESHMSEFERLHAPQGRVNAQEAFCNLQRLAPWLKLLGVTHDPKFLRKVASKSRTENLRLLTELYLKLEDRDNIHLITKQRESYLLSKSSGKFSIKPAEEPKIIFNEENENKDLEIPLLKNKELIYKYKKYKTKMELQERIEVMNRKNMLRIIKEKTDGKSKKYIDSRKPFSKTGYKNASYFLEKVLQKENGQDFQRQFYPKDPINYLKQKHKKTLVNETLKLKMFSLITHDLWIAIFKKQGENISTVFNNVLKQQSEYEKKLSLELLKLHNTYKAFMEQKVNVEFDLQILNSIRMYSSYSKESKEELNLEKARILELHCRMEKEYFNQLRKIAIENCEKILSDFIDYSVIFSEYQNLNGPVPVNIINEWKELFYNEFPINIAPYLNISNSTIDVKKYNNLRKYTLHPDVAHVLGDFNRDNSPLNETVINLSVGNYLNLEAEWNIDIILDFSKADEDLIPIGYIVHTLLDNKYPLPSEKIFANLHPHEVRAVIGNINDSDVIKKMRHYLKKFSVSLIDINVVTNFCLKKYYLEKTYSTFAKRLKGCNSSDSEIEEFSKFDFESRFLFPRNVSSKTEKNKNVINKNTDSKMSINKLKQQKAGLRKKVYSNKKIQWPSKFEKKVPNHTYVGILGKMAFETINTGKTLNDILLCKMIVEYIKSFPKKKGFVLVGYPNTYNQAALLEFIITGKTLPTYIPTDKINVIDIFSSNLKPIQDQINTSMISDFHNVLNDFIDVKTNEKPREKEEVKEENQQLEVIKGKENIYKIEDEIIEKEIGINSKKIHKKRKTIKPTKSTAEHSTSNKIQHTSSDIFLAQNRAATAEGIELTGSASTLNSSEIEICPPKTIQSAKLKELRESRILPNPLPKPEEPLLDEPYFCKYISVKTNASEFTKSKPDCTKIQKLYGFKFYENKENNFPSEYLLRNLRCQPEYLVNELGSEEFYRRLNVVETIMTSNYEDNSIKKLVHFILDRQQDDKFLETYSEVKKSKSRIGCMNELIDYLPVPAGFNIPQIVIDAVDDENVFLTSQVTSNYSLEFDQQIFSDNETNLQVGELGLQLQNVNISQKMKLALATLWESVEQLYLVKLKNAFFKQKFLKSNFLPYKNFIHHIKNVCLQQQDERMKVVNNFQLMFNAVDEDFRKTPQMKNELHYRVEEVREILILLSDNKKKFSYIKKNELLRQSWITDYVYAYINSYLKIMQLELDRFIDSIQLLNDYYICILKGVPDEKHLTKLELKNVSQIEDEPVSTVSIKKKRKSLSKPTSDSNELRLSEDKISDVLINPAQAVLRPRIVTISHKIKGTLSISRNLIRNEYLGKELKRMLESKKKEKKPFQKLDNKGNTRTGTSRRTHRKTLSRKQTPSPSPVTSVKELDLIEKIKLEWEKILQKEADRLNFRIGLIAYKVDKETEETIELMVNIFQEFDREVSEQYEKEIQNIEDICEVFRAAIEDDLPIQPLLILDTNNFYIDKSNLLFPDEPPILPKPIEEKILEYEFQINQLDNLATKLSHMAPHGIVRESFITVLDDLIKNGKFNYIPSSWSKLTLEDICTILTEMFGDSAVINWKDFILFGANIPFPKIEELIELKTRYQQIDINKTETITYEQFDNTPLWFDKEFGKTIEEDLHFALIKNLLFKLFQINNFEINYTELLLAFCKSERSIEGFIKAIIILDDNGYILSGDECYINFIKETEAHAAIKEILTSLANNMYNSTDKIVVKTLRQNFPSIFASNKNEYLESEKNLMYCKRRENAYSSEGLITVREDLEEEEEEIIHLDSIYNNSIWQKCIPYNLVLTILMMVLNFYSLSPHHYDWQLNIESRLAELYRDKGKGDLIKIFEIIESRVFKDIIKYTKIFQVQNITKLIDQLLSWGQEK